MSSRCRRGRGVVLFWAAIQVGCAAGPWQPDYPARTRQGYACDAQGQCRDSFRCYRRFPNSEGRCVFDHYAESHDRGCKTDRDCHSTEICEGATHEGFGDCRAQFHGSPRAIESPQKASDAPAVRPPL